MRVELVHVPGCAHMQEARRALESCMAELGIESSIIQREAAHPSPTILINGEDVMGAPAATGPACRLDVPTTERVMAALVRARRQESEGSR